MDGSKKRVHQRSRRGLEEVSRHWLNEGAAGQQSLFLELDPVLYALDPDIARLAVSRAHAYDGDERRPFAVLAPPSGSVGWQAGLFAKHFNLYLWAETQIEEFDAAVDYFGLEWVIDLASRVTGIADFIAVTDRQWNTKRQLLTVAGQVAQALGPEGLACFALQAVLSPEELLFTWGDGTTSTIREICQALGAADAAVPLRSAIETAEVLARVDRFDRERVANFLKRHRDFFGREAHGFLAERLSDDDFVQAFTDPAAVAVLLTIQR